MAWDDDKSTAADPDNPTAAEQLTATEWDTHVGDQKGRLEYGLLANRPAASNRTEGDLWFDEYGRISRVNGSGNWELEGLGTEANRTPASAFTDVDTNTFTQNLQGASAYLGANQTGIASGTFVTVQYDTENYDDRGEYDTTTYQFTATDAGTYVIKANVQWGGFTGAEVALQVMVNGSARSFTSRSQDSGFATIGTTLVFNLAAGDTVSVESRQSSGATQDIIGSQSATNLTVARIG